MTVEVAVGVESELWDGLPEAERIVVRAAEAAWAGADRSLLPAGRPAEISVALADDALVHRLNRDYRGKDKPTNVLSFPLLDHEDGDEPGDETGMQEEDGAPILLGDVILAHETVAREAAEQGKTFEEHVVHLVVHGVLHLLGYDHETDEDADRMERLEARILEGLGVADPYADGARVESRPETSRSETR